MQIWPFCYYIFLSLCGIAKEHKKLDATFQYFPRVGIPRILRRCGSILSLNVVALRQEVNREYASQWQQK